MKRDLTMLQDQYSIRFSGREAVVAQQVWSSGLLMRVVRGAGVLKRLQTIADDMVFCDKKCSPKAGTSGVIAPNH